MAWSATLVPDPDVRHLAVSPDAVWLASDKAIYVSTDNGATVDAKALDLPSLDPKSPPRVVSLAARGSTLFLASDAHVLVGDDFAKHTKLAFAPTHTKGGAIAPSPIAGLGLAAQQVLLAERNGTVRRGDAWQPLPGVPSHTEAALAIHGNADAHLYLVFEDGLAVSTDGGASWHDRSLPEPGHLAVGRGGAAMLLGDRLHLSTDAAASWKPLELNATAVAGGACAGEWMVASSEGLSLSRDQGASFSPEALSLAHDVGEGADFEVTTLWRGETRGFGLGRVTIDEDTRPVLLIAQALK